MSIVRNDKAAIRASLAGPLAEAKMMTTPMRSLGASSDLDKAVQYFKRLLDIYSELSVYADLEVTVPCDLLDQLRTDTRAFIGRPKVWRIIEHVAIELMWNSSVTGAEATGVIQQC